MRSHRRPRGKILFEVLCALLLGASLAGAGLQTGATALLASASIAALFAFYWSFGLFAREPAEVVEEPAVVQADVQEIAVEPAAPAEVFAREPEFSAPEPEPVAAAPKKRRARKAPKPAPVEEPVAAMPEPVAIEVPVVALPENFAEPVSYGPPIEQLFDPQPYVRQQRAAFGRKAR